MSYNHGPVLARKRLATALRELREQRGYTLDYVAGELLISGSKLSRLEKAQGIPQLRDIRDLVGFYGLKEASAGESLMRWARDGRRKGWWTDFSDVVRPEDTDFIGYENEATVSLQYCIPVIPGLLQTPSYARALLSNTSPQWGERELNRVVETRAIRQQNLHERDGFRPLELKVILHEACLMQSVGSAAAFREQLIALQTAAKSDNIDVRVLPFSADPHAGSSSMWQHFSFGEDIDRDVVFLETCAGMKYIEDEPTVRRFERWFAELTRRSLDPEISVARIRDAISTI